MCTRIRTGGPDCVGQSQPTNSHLSNPSHFSNPSHPPKLQKPKFRLTAPVRREWPLHRQIADLLTLEIAPPGRVSLHGVVWWSIDIADYAGVAGARKARGVIAGVPDLFLLFRGRAHKIELKVYADYYADAGILSDAQRSVAAATLAAGGRVGVACTAEQVLGCLDQWEIPRAHRVRL